MRSSKNNKITNIINTVIFCGTFAILSLIKESNINRQKTQEKLGEQIKNVDWSKQTSFSFVPETIYKSDFVHKLTQLGEYVFGAVSFIASGVCAKHIIKSFDR